MRILITGTGGGVGGALAARLSSAHDVLACDHARLDITDAGAVAACVAAFRPDFVFNPAAITNVDACEEAPERARQVNALAPGYLAAAAERAGARFVQVSTDYVFDGRKGAPYVEDDALGAINIYGETKIAGEQAALAACSWTYIARTAWVMNPARPGFLAAMLAAAPSGAARVAHQTSSPTGLSDLVAALARIIETPPPFGIYHLVNGGACTRAQMAAEVFRLIGADVVITEVPLATFGGAPRPDYTALNSTTWEAAGMPAFRPWPAALADVLRAVKS